MYYFQLLYQHLTDEGIYNKIYIIYMNIKKKKTKIK